MKPVSKLHCKFNKIWARVHGIIWDGHCWDSLDNEYIFCVDCGTKEKVSD